MTLATQTLPRVGRPRRTTPVEWLRTPRPPLSAPHWLRLAVLIAGAATLIAVPLLAAVLGIDVRG